MSATLTPTPTPSHASRPARARATFLMCPPTLYDVDYVINPWMAGNVHASSRERAAGQWQALYTELSSLADILLIDPQPGSPDMVFTANAGLEFNGSVAVSSFFHPERQAEEDHFRRWFEHHGYPTLDLPRTAPFEGEGDALFSTGMSRLWIGEGPRTDSSSHRILASAWPVDLVALRLVDPRFYHLDTCFAPLSDGCAMYFPSAFDAPSLASTHRHNASLSKSPTPSASPATPSTSAAPSSSTPSAQSSRASSRPAASPSSRSISASSSKPAVPPNAS